MSDDIIKRALGMGVSEEPEDQKALVPYEGETIEPIDDEVEMDFEYVRENLTDLIAKGKDAIEELLLIAKQSQHPRAFEVVATLLKATADINADLLATHKKKADLRPTQGATHTKGVGGVTNNNVFVGSTAELQTMLENLSKTKKKENE
jgi:hypothetical protein